MSRRRRLAVVALVVCYLVSVPVLVHATVLPAYLLPGCGPHAPTAPTAGADIALENDTLVVDLTDGSIPADGTRHLDAVVVPQDGGVEDRTEYRLLGPDGGRADAGTTFTVANPTVDGRPLEDGDVVRVVWEGYDLHPQPSYCPGDEGRSRIRTTLAKWTVGEA
ncbi:hypothetical protein [Haloglomus litoreum]|uniref:hypothetical protein n=1 Tax=Haloglomus litoreum TaxID=3034026 RepID=UPI0023E8F3FB|nr:hypothetical protein [Haloglomus sp. DT116]